MPCSLSLTAVSRMLTFERQVAPLLPHRASLCSSSPKAARIEVSSNFTIASNVDINDLH